MDTIRTARNEGVLTLEIDRQDKRNAIDMPMFDRLARELALAQSDDAVKAVLLCSAGDSFTAGHDLAAFELWPQTPDDPVPRFLHALAGLRKPLVIALQGWAVGIGATSLLHADWIVGTPKAKIRFPFVDLGIAPEAGSTLLLARTVGLARARQLLISGEAITAEQAHAWGLVTELRSLSEVRAAAVMRAQSLAAKPGPLVAKIKEWLAPAAEVRARMGEEVEAINQAVLARRSS